MIPSMRLCGMALLIGALALVGCSDAANAPTSPDLDSDAAYPAGAYREDLETHLGAGAFFWIVNEVPRDEFAAAYIKAMVSLRRPRPVSYEVFTRRSLSHGNAYYRDYVFYNDQNRVLYSARRSAN